MSAGSQTRPAQAFTARKSNLLINYNDFMTWLGSSLAVSIVGPTALGVYVEFSMRTWSWAQNKGEMLEEEKLVWKVKR